MSLAGYIAVAVAGGLGMYLGIAGLLEWRYYRRRGDAATWKLQPTRWPSRRHRRDELLLGVANMTLASIGSGWFAHHVATGGASSIHLDLSEHGVAFFAATTILYFVGTDFLLYAAHRTLHRRALFRAIHRVHHRWTSPTAFTAMAMHPLPVPTSRMRNAPRRRGQADCPPTEGAGGLRIAGVAGRCLGPRVQSPESKV